MKRIFLAIMVLCACALIVPEQVEAQKSWSKVARKRQRALNKLRTSRRGRRTTFGPRSYWAFGVGIGSANYFGDLAPRPTRFSTDLGFTRSQIELSAEYRFSARFSARGFVGWARIKGDDFESADPNDEGARFRYVRNLSFRNDLWEIGAVANFDIIENFGPYVSRPRVAPYVTLGISAFYHNPKALAPEGTTQAGQLVSLQKLGTEGQRLANSSTKPYSLVQVAIPMGIGARVRVTNELNVSLEFTYRHLFPDYIDDVSGQYIDKSLFTDDLTRVLNDRSAETKSAAGDPRVAVSGLSGNLVTVNGANGSYSTVRGYGSPNEIRGNPRDNDQLFFTTIRISYILSAQFRGARYR